MNIQEIKALIEALQASDMTSFSYQKDGLKLKIEKSSNPLKSVSRPQALEIASVDPQAIEDESMSEGQSVSIEVSKDNASQGNWISSPLVGIYYGSPSPNSPSFVKVGDTVKKGDVLCIIEAMKVMNEITSEYDGKVLEIAGKNESLVEYGQPLILIG